MNEEFSGSTACYRSIFLDDGWVSQKYLGWNLVGDLEGVRLLTKSRLGVTRWLILLTRGGEGSLEEVITNVFDKVITDVIIHDFDYLLPANPRIASRQFCLASKSERVLNIATYVIDLQVDEKVLWERLGSKTRNAVRKGQSGLTAQNYAEFEQTADAFFLYFKPIAKRLGLQVPNRRMLHAMFKNGNLACFIGCDQLGGVKIANFVYLSGSKSYYLFGASAEDIEPGAGQFLQWQTFLSLKRAGFTWYDLGGIQDPNIVDGVHRFKKSLGGSLCMLGNEYRFYDAGYRVIKIISEASKVGVGYLWGR